MKKRLRILLVDDDEEEYLLTQDLLTDRSYSSDGDEQVKFDLDWVATYEAALQAFKSGNHDVYLLDYHLGGRDGLELLREVIAMGCQKPIIVMTGRGSYDLDIEVMKAGATDYLVKGEVTAPLLERTIRYSIERKRTEEEILKNAERAEALANLSQAFAEANLNFPAVIETITRRISESLGDRCILRLATEDGIKLKPAGNKKQEDDLPEGDERLCWQVYQTGKTIFLPDGEPDAKREAGEEKARSLMIVPLWVRGQIAGTISAIRYESSHPYLPEDLVFLQDLAGRAGLAIENVRLFQAEAQRALELDALNRATVALLSTIEPDGLLDQILDAAKSAIPAAEMPMLHLLPHETGELKARAREGFSGLSMARATLLNRGSYLARVVLDRKPIMIRDIKKMETGVVDGFGSLKVYNIRSAIVAPLILGDIIYGAISLSSTQPDAFNEADVRLLGSFAATTTAAMQNAMLHAEVQKTAITDALTDIYNRRGLLELGKREVERARRFGRPLSVMMVDLDKFKDINDSFGHAAGDEVLRIIADRLRSSIRDVDILGRWGGDEFLILLPEADLFMARMVADRIRLRVAEPFSLLCTNCEGKPFALTASLGVANLVGETVDLASLVERADLASYLAKHEGRNKVQVG